MFFSKHKATVGGKFDRVSYLLLVAITLIMPICIGVPVLVTPSYTKIAVGALLTLAAVISYVIARMTDRVVQLPRSYLPLVAWMIPVAYLLSAFFSTGSIRSLFGERLSIDSFASVAIMVTVLTLVPLIIRSQKRALGIYLAFLVSSGVLALLQLGMFFARETLVSAGFALPISLLGSLNDMSVFFGLIVIFVLLALTILPITHMMRIILWVPLSLAGLFLAIVNLHVLWWVVGFFALGCLVYSVATPYFAKKGAPQTSVSIASLTVLVLAGLFLFGSESLTTAPAQWANVGELDVRPSWETTVSIGTEVLKEHTLFGSGPGSFARLWALHMPNEINSTTFWQSDFLFGIGFIPTSIISTGLLGGIAWFAFLAFFVWHGVQKLILVKREGKNPVIQFFRVSSFVGGLYLWIIAIIQVPSPALVYYAAILTGLFVASLMFGDDAPTPAYIRFEENPRIGFSVTLLLTVGILISVAGIYGVGSKYIAEVEYEKAMVLMNTTGAIDEVQPALEAIVNREPIDVYYRTLSNIDLIRMQQLVSAGKTPEEIMTPLQDMMSRSIRNGITATELDPNDYQNWLNLGALYQSISPLGVEGSLDSAQAAFDRVLTLRPNSPAVYYGKAGIERQRGNHDEARKQVEKAIALRPMYTDAIFLLAQMQLEQNDVVNAIKSVEAVTVFERENPVAFFQLGLLYYGSNNFANAITALEQAVALNPIYANARYFLGLSYVRMNNLPKALAEFKKVQETNQENTEVAAIIANLTAGRQPFDAPSTPTEDIQTRSATPISGADAADVVSEVQKKAKTLAE
jgi:cytochrome c-type biogenesis protein CcmH/NrfG